MINLTMTHWVTLSFSFQDFVYDLIDAHDGPMPWYLAILLTIEMTWPLLLVGGSLGLIVGLIVHTYRSNKKKVSE